MRTVISAMVTSCVVMVLFGCGRATEPESPDAKADVEDSAKTDSAKNEKSVEGARDADPDNTSSTCHVPDLDGAIIECPADGGCSVGCNRCFCRPDPPYY